MSSSSEEFWRSTHAEDQSLFRVGWSHSGSFSPRKTKQWCLLHLIAVSTRDVAQKEEEYTNYYGKTISSSMLTLKPVGQGVAGDVQRGGLQKLNLTFNRRAVFYRKLTNAKNIFCQIGVFIIRSVFSVVCLFAIFSAFLVRDFYCLVFQRSNQGHVWGLFGKSWWNLGSVCLVRNTGYKYSDHFIKNLFSRIAEYFEDSFTRFLIQYRLYLVTLVTKKTYRKCWNFVSLKIIRFCRIHDQFTLISFTKKTFC